MVRREFVNDMKRFIAALKEKGFTASATSWAKKLKELENELSMLDEY
ncbi:hypothetical protein [Rhizobium sp. PP-F2F-G48]|nr:hypothetical protein [Rhizobium sp. PP-F2F-G48]